MGHEPASSCWKLSMDAKDANKRADYEVAAKQKERLHPRD